MAWGGARPGSGPKSTKAAVRKPAAPAPAAPAVAPASISPNNKLPSPRVFAQHMTAVAELSKAAVVNRDQVPQFNPFKLPDFPPKAQPPEDTRARMAMDDGSSWAASAWGAAGVFNSIASEGLLFLGYAYLAELAQRPEYRIMSETIATEMTRKWIKFRGASEDEDKSDKIKELDDFLSHLQARERYATAVLQDGLFGRAHIFHGFGNDDDLGELKTDIGNGRDKASDAKVTKGPGKGSLMRLQNVEPVWCYPTTYNANNPLAPDWYNPQVWYVQGQEIHASRLLKFVSRPVPDLLKPSYAFGGLALTQLSKPYVDIWLKTRESIGELIHAFSVMVLSTDLSTIMQPGTANNLLARVAMFNALRDNQGTFVVNKATEDFKNVAAPVSGLHELQSQAQEHMMSICRIPAVKFTGNQPAGLNATSEGEIRAFYDTINAGQNHLIRPNLDRTVDFAMLSLWGKRDPDITYDFVPLWELTEKEKAEKRKADAETGAIHIDSGVISPEEERGRIANDPETLYPGLDSEDVPDLAEEEEQGLEPQGGRPDPKAKGEPDNDNGGGKPDGGGADDAALPFELDGAALELIFDSAFNEGDHPRGQPGNAGQFGSGGGGSTSGKGKSTSKSAKASTSTPAPIEAAKLKRVGEQMGSNPGGVFEDGEGRRYYVKQGKSAEHVKNELTAAALYGLADAPTLDYHPVKGGGHIATAMRKLDKDNAHKLSPAEITEARRDFVAHAWLANWDAVGLGGDNLGTVEGKPTALDLGGALNFRAQGAPKGKAFGNEVGELDTLRNAKMNPDAAAIFGGMTPAELVASARRVTEIPDAAIRKAVADGGMGRELADKLIARKADIAAVAADLAKHGPAKDETPDGLVAIELADDVWVLAPLQAHDAGGFEEAKHPRVSGGAKGGQFAPAGGGGGGSTEDPDDEPEQEPEMEAGEFYPGHSPEPAEPAAQTFKSKKDHVAHLLTNGTTAAEVLKATGWPSVSMPAQAKAAKMHLIKYKEGGVTKYKGTPIKEGEAPPEGAIVAKPKAPKAPEPVAPPAPPAPVASVTEAAAAQALKDHPDMAAIVAAGKYNPTAAELEKAKKGNKLQLQYVPGAPATPAAQKLVDEFNAKYEGKTLTTTPALTQKVRDFKVLAAKMAPLQAAHAAQAAAEQAAAQAAAKAQATAAAANLKKAQDEAKAQNKKYMAELGISETEAMGFHALVQMIGKEDGSVSTKDVIEKFKKYEKQAAELGYPITGFQYALIRNYINGGYKAVNRAMREGSMSPAQHVYGRLVNAALDKLPKYAGTVTRGTTLTAEQLSIYKPGHVIEERSFTLSGIGYKFGGNVHYTIKASGSRGADFSTGANTSEKEVLFKAHTFFLVHKVENKGGDTYIEMEEVEGHG